MNDRNEIDADRPMGIPESIQPCLPYKLALLAVGCIVLIALAFLFLLLREERMELRMPAEPTKVNSAPG